MGTLFKSQHGFGGNKEAHNSEGAGVLWALNVMVKHANDIKLFRGKKICGWDVAAAKAEIQVHPWLLVFCPPLTQLEVV